MKKIGIVRALFNSQITLKMLETSKRLLSENNLPYIVREVPGAYDIPLAVKELLKDKDIIGVVVLAAIIKGETKHDEVIANALANSIHSLSLQYEKPIGFGVVGPGATWAQAEKRAEDYALRACEVVLKWQSL